MKVEDLHGDQDVALIARFKDLPKGTLGNVLAYSPTDNTVLVRMRNQKRTEENGKKK